MPPRFRTSSTASCKRQRRTGRTAVHDRRRTSSWASGERASRTPVRFDVSPWTVLKIVLTLLVLFGLWEIRVVMVIIFLTLILVAALRPGVDWLESRGFNRVLASGVAVVGVVVILGGALFLLASPLVDQFQNLVQGRLPKLIERFSAWYRQEPHSSQVIVDVQKVVDTLVQQLQSAAGQVLTYVSSLVDIVVAMVAVLVLAFYTLADRSRLLGKLVLFVPSEHRAQVEQGVEHVEIKLGQWLRGQLVLCVVMAILVSVAALLIGVPAWAAVGILAGVFELVPYVGPLLTAVTMILMAATADTNPLLKMALALSVYVVLQFLEGHVLVPKVMQRALGISPALVILAVLVGAHLGHLLGTILAIPIAAVIEAVVEVWPVVQRSGIGEEAPP
jgi:predicted PurR-regulated permease PerM